jgi:multiple sugar transport system permease protein
MRMFPALLAIAVWQYYPLVKVAVMAFQDYRVLGESRFIGMDNFINMLNSDIFWRSILNTLYYVALTLALGFFALILLAILLQEVPRGSLYTTTPSCSCASDTPARGRGYWPAL